MVLNKQVWGKNKVILKQEVDDVYIIKKKKKMMPNWKEIYKREDNWKKYPYLYNEERNMTFECECGKKYVSFPGLYLHFQRKHNQKISTKPE